MFKALFLGSVMAMLAVNAEEILLRNGNFSEKSRLGLPLHWDVRSKELANVQVSAENDINVLKLKAPKGEMVFLIQNALPLKENTSYQVSYQVRSTAKNSHRVYCEWKNDTGSLQAANGGWSATPEEWEDKSFSFLFPEKGKGAYLVLNPSPGGEVEFRHIKLEKADSGNLLKNPDFLFKDSKGNFKNWNFLSGKRTAMSIQNKILFLKADANEQALLLQPGLTLVPGKKYPITAEVKSETPVQYRIYCEWRQAETGNATGALQSVGGYYRTASTDWKKDTVTINFPAEAKNPYLVLCIKGPGAIQFRNLRLAEAENEIPANAVTLGGTWKLSGEASFVKGQDKAPILEIRPKNGQIASAALSGVKVIPGKRYELICSIAGSGNAGSDTGYHPYRISVKYPGIMDDGGIWDDTQNSFFRKTVPFTVPAKLADATAEFLFESKTHGAIQIRDLALKQLPPLEEQLLSLQLKAPYFRDQLYASDQTKEISGEIQASNAKKVEVKLCNHKGLQIVENKIELDHGRGNFSIPAEKLPYGDYWLKVSAEINGKTIRLERKITKLKPAPFEVTYRSGNVFYINGEPFFPVLFWDIIGAAIDKDDKTIERALYFAAREGINGMVAQVQSAAQAKRILDAAQKYGMKIFLWTGNAPDTCANVLAIWEHRISGLLIPEVAQHPALFGYFLADEPYWTGKPVKPLIASYEILKSLDPYHPVWINAAPRGSVEVHAEYSKAADIYGVDIYPVPYPNSHSGLSDKGMTSVGKYVARMDEACGFRKPIWMALQGFAWGTTNKTKKIYPTFAETRFMAYDALTAGANSPTYWGIHRIDREDFYRDLYRMTRELHAISGVLTRGQLCNTVKADNPNLRYRAFQWQQHTYLLAVNLTGLEQNGIFSGIKSEKLEVIGEKRSIQVKNGVFKDHFAPYAVHAYASGALPPPAYSLPAKDENLEKMGNPAFEHMKELAGRISYQGNANWIWAKSSVNKPYSKVWLCRSFQLDKPLKNAELTISADDDYIVHLNGKPVGSDVQGEKGGWSQAEIYDVTSMLKQGENAIAIEGSDAGVLPCGVIAELSLVYQDGTRQQIITDSTWKASDVFQPDWRNPTRFNQWEQAHIVTPYGSGAWGANMSVRKE